LAKAIGIRPQVYGDIAESAQFIGRDNLGTADRFIDACDSTFQLLSAAPQMGEVVPSAVHKLSGMRSFRIQGFPIVALYIERDLAIEILRVIHGARDLENLIPEIS
jgi:toxin ParE1/3/4